MKNPADKKKKQKRKMGKDIIFLVFTLLVLVILLSIFPQKQRIVIITMRKFFIEMISILPAITVLIGLFSVFVPKEMVVKYLSKTAGIKAILLGIVIGALPTGPLYVAFPIASALLKKGARISCIIAFLSAWACIKIPQEMVELQFLGLKFMAARLTLTIIFVVIMGIFIEQLIEWSEKNRQIEGGKDDKDI